MGTLARDLIIAGLVAGSMITAAGAYIFWDSWQQMRLRKVQGTVLESAVVREADRSIGDTGARQYWTINVRYAYQVGEQTYTGNRYSSTAPTSPAGEPPSPELLALLARYPRGATVDVFILPEAPEVALLKPRTSPSWIVLLVGLAVLVPVVIGWLRRR